MATRKEYVVGVTGSAGYKDEKQNPSSTVRDRLPARIERDGFLPIRVLKYDFDFRNVLEDMDRIPKLWNRHLNVYDSNATDTDMVYIDAMIHMGMKPEESRWVVETNARRDGYDWVGDDGKRIPAKNGGPGAMFEGLPEVLKPMYDVAEIEQHLAKAHPDIPLGVSDDAGRKYCELQLYTSLATLYRRKEPARVMYFHVTGSVEEEDIQRGVAVARSLITALVDSSRENGADDTTPQL